MARSCHSSGRACFATKNQPEGGPSSGGRSAASGISSMPLIRSSAPDGHGRGRHKTSATHQDVPMNDNGEGKAGRKRIGWAQGLQIALGAVVVGAIFLYFLPRIVDYDE